MEMLYSDCSNYLKYFGIKTRSFFEEFSRDLKVLLKVISRYCGSQQIFSIIRTLSVSKSTVEKLLNALICRMGRPDFSNNKLGGFG